MATILIVDDEKSIRVTLQEFLRTEDYEVLTAESAEEAFDLMAKQAIDVVVSDIILPKISGVELLQKIKKLGQTVEVVMITGHPAIETAAAAVRAGAFDYISKPVSFNLIKKVVSRALAMKTLNDEKQELQRALEASEEKFRKITTNAKDAIIMTDSKGEVAFWNRAAKETFGYSEDEVMGKELHHLLSTEEDLETFRHDFPCFRSTEKNPLQGNTLAIKARRKDGTEIPLEISLSTMVLREEYYTISMARDITERKEYEEKLLNVIVNTSHLVNTPLTLAMGQLEMVKMGYKEANSECVEGVHKNLLKIKRLVNEELERNLAHLEKKTSDGLTPVKRTRI